MTTKESPATFRTGVNVVMVPVVVRDGKGRIVSNLTKEEFQLFDKGKLQDITRFTVEKSGPKKSEMSAAPPQLPAALTGEDQTPPPDIPERFVAYLFDDIHIEFGDLARARDAAVRQLEDMKVTDRAAVYTTSGQGQIEFTDDKQKLRDAIMAIRQHPISSGGNIMQCPDVSYYMADMMINKNDQAAIMLATNEAMACNPGMQQTQAASLANAVAMGMLTAGRHETQIALISLKEVARRMAGMPGQRIVVLISPGFITPSEQQEKMDVLDRAIKGNIMISTMDARGLWTDPAYDASRPNNSHSAQFLIMKSQYDRETALAQEDVLAELAYGTGGTFFHNNNDLLEGLRQTASAPESYYLLGFSPQNLKLDGSFHGLKVTLKLRAGLDVQARKGYYAPKRLSDAAETAKEEIEEALFSREEMHELPVELHTQFFKSSEKDATLAVLCRMDAKHLPFHKTDGRNVNTITIVSGIFDRNGNFISGIQKTVELHLKDETLAHLMNTGMSVRTNFSVGPGTYMVRLVVRDSDGQLMSAANGAVSIP